MNQSNTLKNYLDELSSNSPTPGGGNVSALCGALASSLGTMVCRLTIGKKKYIDVEPDMMKIRSKLESFREEFIDLAAKDNAAFDKVMEAFKFPKETENDKTMRLKKISAATLEAAKVPAEVITSCKVILPLIKTIAEKGNQNSVSDAGVAALLLSTAAQGAYLNVLINCSSLKDNSEAQKLLAEASVVKDEIKSESNNIIEVIIKGFQS
ncbi:MAG: cyclodeaminase/cyclohydrolase family protein [Ignavibacteriales bacterium]|nr:cyclodeaminase/cyclohydrolase family protein [Ignavibacteriales bacterium]